MSQPPDSPGQNPQWGPQNTGATPWHPEAQPSQGPAPQDGQPYAGPLGPDGQPYNGPLGPDGQPYNGPLGPDGQPYNGEIRPHQGTKFGVRQVITGVLVVVLLSVGAFFVWQSSQKDAALAVGNCLVFTGTPSDADHKLVDCEDTSVYSEYVGEVIEGNGQCADPQAASYTISETDGSGNTKDVTKITCLVPQLVEGQCYAQLPEGSVNDLEPVDCSTKDFEVTKVVNGSNPQCDAGSEAISFTVPERTYCIAFES